MVRDLRDRRRELALVRARHPFWTAGGPGGIEHQAGGAFLRPDGAVERCAREQRRERHSVAATVRRHDPPGRIDAKPRGSFGRRALGGAVIGHDDGLSVFQTICDLVCRRPPADRRKDGSQQLAGPVERRHLIAIAHDDDEMVAGLKPHLAQSSGGGADLARPLRVGAAAAALDDCLAAWLAEYREGECGADVHAQPAPCSIVDAASRMASTIAA